MVVVEEEKEEEVVVAVVVVVVVVVVVAAVGDIAVRFWLSLFFSQFFQREAQSKSRPWEGGLLILKKVPTEVGFDPLTHSQYIYMNKTLRQHLSEGMSFGGFDVLKSLQKAALGAEEFQCWWQRCDDQLA